MAIAILALVSSAHSNKRPAGRLDYRLTYSRVVVVVVGDHNTIARDSNAVVMRALLDHHRCGYGYAA